MKYPTMDKLYQNRDAITAIESFLGWLSAKKRYLIMSPNGSIIHTEPLRLIYEYLDIDPAQLDHEREALYAEVIRQQNAE